MTISEKSIISSEPPKAGIPIKKGTIAAILGTILLGTLATSFLFQQASSKKVDVQDAPKPSSKATAMNGSTAEIDAERADSASKLARGVSASQSESVRPAATNAGQSTAVIAGASSVGKVTATPLAGSASQPNGAAAPTDPRANPIPPNLRRSDQTAALYDGTRATAGQPVGAKGYAVANGPSVAAEDQRLQEEADVRRAKSIAFDEDGGSSTGSSPQTAQTQKGALSSTSIERLFNTIPVVTKAPSDTVQPALDAAVAELKKSTGQQTAKKTTGDRGWLTDYASETGEEKHQVTKSYPTVSQFTLHQGKIIPVVLGRQVNSDLPGTITAYTLSNVYDSMGQGNLLIPKGSALVGRYDSDVKMGQSRLMFAFQRLIMPNGQSFDLPAAQGSDLAGAAGAEGDVNNHFFKIFGSSFLIAWAANSVQQPNITVNTAPNATSAAGQVLADVSNTILSRYKNLSPTITLNQGERLNVEVVRDMEFPGAYKTRSAQ